MVRVAALMSLALMIVFSVSANAASTGIASESVSASQVSVTYTFARPELSKVKIADVEYDRVVLAGLSNSGNAGSPSLPARAARILLPYETSVADIEIRFGKAVSLGSGYVIEPGTPLIRLSHEGPLPPVEMDRAVYESDNTFPPGVYEHIGTQVFRGYNIVTLKLTPVAYRPASGTLYYYPEMTVVVNTQSSRAISDTFRSLSTDARTVAAKIDNQDAISTYPSTARRGDKSYDLLIITTPTLASSFTPLKTYHDAQGISTTIKTTTDIGSSSPDDIRDYIRTEYQTNGIEYVIIGADDDIIAAKDLYVRTDSSPYAEIETAMPGDIYFACLDGTYNYDGDSYWGEPTDGTGGGDVDLVAEVYVGRAAVGNTTEAARFVDKTIWYLNGQHSQLEKVILVGEHLGFGGVSEYAGYTLEELVDASSSSGYTTVGIPSAVYTIEEMFERDMTWTQSTIISRINSGYHILNHLGHGDTNYAMKLYNTDITASLTNDDLCFIYSQTCLAGHFDGTECWAETINTKTSAGAFAVVMNARYGIGASYSTDGPSQRFNREFWDAVFGEGKPQLGKANQDSKEDNVYRINEDCMRWCTYELNLFGDPTVAIQGVVLDLSISLPNGAPAHIAPGVPTAIQVTIDEGDENYVPGSGMLHYRYDGGTFQSIALVHISGNTYEGTLPAAACSDVPQFYFSAAGDASGVQYTPAGAPLSAYSAQVGHAIEMFADDFETDKGWVATKDASLTDGEWEQGIPAGGGLRGDPAADYDGSGSCYLTHNAPDNTDVDDGTAWLTSPALDLSGGDAEISYALWYTNDFGSDPDNDLFKVYASDDNGSTWTVVEVFGPESSSGWTAHTFTVGNFVDLTAQVRVRFEVSDLNSGSVVEAGIDAFAVQSFECFDPGDGDCDVDGDIDLADFNVFQRCFGETNVSGTPACGPADMDGNNVVDDADYAAFAGAFTGP